MVAQGQAALTRQELVEEMEVLVVLVVVMVLEVLGVVAVDPWKKPFPVFLAMITQYFLRYQKHPSCVMAKLMVVIMQILNPSAKLSISAQMMEMEEGQSIASSVLMEQSSNSNILCVIGGSMLTVQLLKISTH